MITALLVLLFACTDNEPLVRHTLRNYTHLILVEKPDGSFDFSGADAGRCTGNVWVENGQTGISTFCVWMTRELPAKSPHQPLAAACDSGDPGACVALADSLAADQHVRFGPGEMKDMYVYGCDRGVARGCSGAAWMGERACALGDPAGCLSKARTRRDGTPDVEPDRVGGFADIVPLCLGSLPEACDDVAAALRHSDVEGIPRSEPGAGAVEL